MPLNILQHDPFRVRPAYHIAYAVAIRMAQILEPLRCFFIVHIRVFHTGADAVFASRPIVWITPRRIQPSDVYEGVPIGQLLPIQHG